MMARQGEGSRYHAISLYILTSPTRYNLYELIHRKETNFKCTQNMKHCESKS